MPRFWQLLWALVLNVFRAHSVYRFIRDRLDDVS